MKNIPLAKISNEIITENEEYIIDPSQVLRELIENSIDAGSSKIYIKIDRGGLGLIEVKDNGKGMNPQEMLLSIDGKNNSKNITNKLFGTNGYMLHQISKIGKIELICKEKSKTRGSILKVSNNKIQPVKECYADIGTKIQIRDLFYNNSKIRQLTKDSKNDDFVHIINTYAIAFPKIGFSARIKNEDILNVPIEDKLSKDPFISRIKNVLGKNISNSMIKFSNEIDDVKVSILLTNQKQSFKKDYYQLIFVNQKSLLLSNLSDTFRSHDLVLMQGPLHRTWFFFVNNCNSLEFVESNILIFEDVPSKTPSGPPSLNPSLLSQLFESRALT